MMGHSAASSDFSASTTYREDDVSLAAHTAPKEAHTTLKDDTGEYGLFTRRFNTTNPDEQIKFFVKDGSRANKIMGFHIGRPE
jgi:hypothetical protein